jgi:CO dehydrogenase nickel-insertion accessory protein CooC1
VVGSLAPDVAALLTENTEAVLVSDSETDTLVDSTLGVAEEVVTETRALVDGVLSPVT